MMMMILQALPATMKWMEIVEEPVPVLHVPDAMILMMADEKVVDDDDDETHWMAPGPPLLKALTAIDMAMASPDLDAPRSPPPPPLAPDPAQ